MGRKARQIDPQAADSAVRAALGAIDDAEAVRRALRWQSTPGQEDREARLDRALDLLDQAAKPVRSLIGRLAWDRLPAAPAKRLRAVSLGIQYERRQLKKMRRA